MSSEPDIFITNTVDNPIKICEGGYHLPEILQSTAPCISGGVDDTVNFDCDSYVDIDGGLVNGIFIPSTIHSDEDN